MLVQMLARFCDCLYKINVYIITKGVYIQGVQTKNTPL